MADDADENTSIQVKMSTWSRLNSRKEAPSDTFDDVVNRLLDETDG